MTIRTAVAVLFAFVCGTIFSPLVGQVRSTSPVSLRMASDRARREGCTGRLLGG
jgi:hypothetical protein